MSDDQSIGVIYVEDDDDVRIGGVQALELAGFSVSGFASVETAGASVRSDMPFVVVCDVRLRGKSGLEWLSDLRRLDQDLPVILITGHGDIAMAVQAMRTGAYDFIEKPCSSEQLVSVVRRAVEKRRLTLEVRLLRYALADRQGIEASLLGRSLQIQEVRRLVSTLASTNVDVTIYGETGTGTDVVARCLHNHSGRRGGHSVKWRGVGRGEETFPGCASISSWMPPGDSSAARRYWMSRPCLTCWPIRGPDTYGSLATSPIVSCLGFSMAGQSTRSGLARRM